MIPKKAISGKPYLIKYSTNEREAFIQKQYVEAGWVVLKNGWPDLFCYNPATNEVELVEVKNLNEYKNPTSKRPYRKLGRTQDQMRMHQYLEKVGFKVRTIHVQ